MNWDAKLYERRHSFVWKSGQSLVDWLNPQPGEHILDVGCGPGQLTAEIAARGALVTGIDSSTAMIEQAQAAFPALDFRTADILTFDGGEQFDAVFSNAVLHWVKPPEQAVQQIVRALKPEGRFVCEMGGTGNTACLLSGVHQALQESGLTPSEPPWYFPSIGEYARLLESHDLEVCEAILFDRPTPLEDGEHGLQNWMKMFGAPLTGHVPTPEVSRVLETAENLLRPRLYQEGTWTIDYRRLRIRAKKGRSFN